MLVCCVSETYATTVLSATRDLTTDPTAQAVLTSIYSDEVMHARLGWSYLRHAIDVGGQGVIDAAAEMLPRVAGRPVYLSLAMNPGKSVRMKPQNLLAGLPLRQAKAA